MTEPEEAVSFAARGMPASIADYALLSDCQTSALVGRDGSVDWYCPPRFDSPSVFARLLDEEGGHWSIQPTGPFESGRSYLEGTMVLRTEFSTGGGRVALTDALAFEEGAREHEIGRRSPHVLLRRIEGLEGEMDLAMEFVPRPEYGLTRPLVRPAEGGAIAQSGPVDLHLFCDRPLEISGTRADARFTVRAGETADFALLYERAVADGEERPEAPKVGPGIEDTREGWASWAQAHYRYEGPYRDEVRRSTLVLQALTYMPTGAIVAAPTASVPAVMGGEDNWDYRFAWLRDLGLTMRALWVSACPDEAQRFFDWIHRASGGCLGEGQPQIMYGVEGERDLAEHTLDHLSGFRGNRPVRVGNDAWKQRQLDVLGEVVDSAHLLRDQLGDEFDDPTARLVSALANKAADTWREPDSEMWEARDAERHYLSSKMMCWVALDRAVDLAPRLGDRVGDRASVEKWKRAREETRTAILEEGWCEEIGAYTGAFGSDRLDASVLLMSLVGFLPADDPRMSATIQKIEDDLAPDGLVHRWAGDENGFLLCTYWLVECLVRRGEPDRAAKLFEKATAHANDLGLLAEQADPATGELWGNFPQAFSHVGLINAAWCLAEAEG